MESWCGDGDGDVEKGISKGRFRDGSEGGGWPVGVEGVEAAHIL